MKQYIAAVAIIAGAALAACGGGSTSAAAVPLPALGAVPSQAPAVRIAALGDSITQGLSSLSTVTVAYPTLVGTALGVPVKNLAISGMTLSPLAAGTYGGIGIAAKGGVIGDELGGVPLDSDLVTLYIGTNDMWLWSLGVLPDQSNLRSSLDKAEADYAASMTTLVGAIHARVPRARLIIATVPNTWVHRPHFGQPAAMGAAYSELVRSMKASIIATGATVVDLLCDPAMYDDANFQGIYDVHDNDAGHRAIAADFIAAYNNPKAPGSCKYEQPL